MNTTNALQCLKSIDCFKIHRHASLLEGLTGYQSVSCFSILDHQGNDLMKSFEESSCCQRCWCTNSRELVLHFQDTNNREIIRMTRALKCCCVCCWCGNCENCKQEMVIESPPGTPIGSVIHEASICRMQFTMEDRIHNNRMIIIAPRCICNGKCCCDDEFSIYGTDASTKIGSIRRTYPDSFREALRIAESFELKVPMDLDAKMKAVSIGAVFLIEFMCFIYNYRG